jgi:hypothetical protein
VANQTEGSLDASGRATAEVGQFLDLSNLTAVTDFNLVEVEEVADELVLQPDGRVQTDSAEVAFENLDRSLVGGVFSVAVEGSDGNTGFFGTRRRSGEHQIGEATLASGTNETVPLSGNTHVFVTGGKQVLNLLLCQVSIDCAVDDLILGELEVGRNGKRCVLRSGAEGGSVSTNARGGGVGGGSTLDSKPSVETTCQEGNSAVVSLSTLIGAEGDLNVTLEHGDALGDVVGEFVIDTSDVREVEGHFGHSDDSAELLRVHGQFVTILLGNAADFVLDVVLSVCRKVNVLAVNHATHLGRGELVDLPAEQRVPRLGPLTGHGRERGVLSVNEGDEVSEVFSLTCGDIRFG